MLAKFLFILWMANVIAHNYNLIYVEMLVDEGQTVPFMLERSIRTIENWRQKCYAGEQIVPSANVPGCLTKKSGKQVYDNFAIAFENEYSTKLIPNKDEENVTYFVFNSYIAKDDGKFDASKVLFSDRFKEEQGPGASTNSDFECHKRENLLRMARDGPTKYNALLESAEFQKLFEDVKIKTKHEMTKENHLDRIKDLIVEGAEFDDLEIKRIIENNTDIIIKSSKYNLGLFDEPFNITTVHVDEEIRYSRIAYTFKYNSGHVDNKKRNFPYISKKKLSVVASNSITINSMLIGFGLEGTLTKFEDFFPKAGSSLIIELYQDNVTTTDYAFKVIRLNLNDHNEYFVIDLTDKIPKCNGTVPCPYDVLTNISMNYQAFINCTVDPAGPYAILGAITQTTTPIIDNGSCECKYYDFTCMGKCGIPGGLLIILGVTLFLVIAALIAFIAFLLWYLVYNQSKRYWKNWLLRSIKLDVIGLIGEFNKFNYDTLKKRKLTFAEFQRHKSCNRYETIECIDQTRVPIATDEFNKLNDDTLKKTNLTFTESQANMSSNKSSSSKNEFVDQTRVPITTGNPANGYYHANYVGFGDKPKRFICAQSPMNKGLFDGRNVEDTVYQFLLMLIQENVDHVIMLGRYKYKGERMCARFFHKRKGGVMCIKEEGTENSIEVTTNSTKELIKGVGSTELTLKHSKEGMITFMHYQWSDWEYQSIPSSFEIASVLLGHVTTQQGLKDPPVVVHCADGASQSGALAAIWMVTKGLDEKNNMKNILSRIRTQLYKAIGTDMQYLYITNVLINCNFEAYLPNDSDKFFGWENSYESQLATHYGIKYKSTSDWINKILKVGMEQIRKDYPKKKEVTGATFVASDAHLKCNRSSVKCQDKYRVVVKHYKAPHDYIHANYFGSTAEPQRFILTQGPLDGSEGGKDDTRFSFWATILQEKVETIVMLGMCEENGKKKVAQYWPMKSGEEIELKGKGGVTITVINQGETVSFLKHTFIRKSVFKVTSAADKKSDLLTVDHYQWNNWQEESTVPHTKAAFSLLDKITDTDAPVVIHSSTGTGRAATLAGLWILRDSVQAEKPIENVATLLREYRFGAIENELQYICIYLSVMSHFLELPEYVKNTDQVERYKDLVKEYETLNDAHNARIMNVEKKDKK